MRRRQFKKAVSHSVAWLAGVAFFAVTTPAIADNYSNQDPIESLASIDYCADQYAFALKETATIAGVSRDADSVFSLMPEHAEGLPKTRGSAEDMLRLRPDVSLRQWRGSLAFDHILQKGGIESFNLGFITDQQQIFTQLEALSKRLGSPNAASTFIEQQKAILKNIETYKPLNLRAAYMTPSGYTAGKGTLINDMIKQAGFESMADAYSLEGWLPLPLEVMVGNAPDVIITSFFDMQSPSSHWSASAHPYFKKLLADIPVIDVPSRYLSCGRMFLPNAVQHIRSRADAQKLIKHSTTP